MTPAILLVNPPAHDFTAFDLWLRPVGLLRIGTLLRASGCDVRLLDCLDDDLPFFRRAGAGKSPSKPDGTCRFFEERIQKPKAFAAVPRFFRRFGLPPSEIRWTFESWRNEGWIPDVVAVTSLFTYWYPGVAEAAAAVREAWPSARIVLGGIYPTLCRDHAAANACADEVVQGPGTGWAEDFLQRESLPFRHPPLFADYGLYGHPISHAVVLSSTGCPFSCAYCASRIVSGGYFPRPVSDVVEDVRHAASLGAEHVAFYDDAFLYDSSDRAKPLLAAIADSNLKVKLHFPNGLHVRFLDVETARLLKAARAETVRLSFESTSHDDRAGLPFKASVEELRSAAASLKSAGFDPGGINVYTLVGAPGQDRETIVRTCEAIHGCGFRVTTTLFSPIPGTPAFDDAVSAGLDPAEPLLQNKVAYSLYMGPFPPGEIQEIRMYARSLNEKLVPIGGL